MKKNNVLVILTSLLISGCSLLDTSSSNKTSSVVSSSEITQSSSEKESSFVSSSNSSSVQSDSEVASSSSTSETINNELELLSFKAVEDVQTMALSVEDDSKEVIVSENDKIVNVEAVVKNVNRLSFIDMVLHISFLNTYVVFNEGNGDYVCSTTTVLDNGLWVTKINLSVDVDLSATYSGSIEVTEINFLDLNSKKAATDLNKVDSKKINYHMHHCDNVETIAPTCKEDGYDLFICDYCHEETKTNIVPASKDYHEYVDSYCKYCGEKENNLKGTYKFKVAIHVEETPYFPDLLESFTAKYPDIKVEIEVASAYEGYATSNVQMSYELEDLYFLGFDEIERLKNYNVLAKPSDESAKIIADNNDEMSVEAASVNGEIYAYPYSTNGGYFMYYDKRYIQESSLDSLEAIIKDCEDSERYFSFATEESWYSASWFFGAGCESTWKVNDKGEIVGVTDNFNSEKGIIAAKGMKKLLDSNVYSSWSQTDAFNDAMPSAVCVSGIWGYQNAKSILGDNLGVTDLPSFTVDGESYHLGSFSTYKMLGIKPQTDEKRQAVLELMAEHFTNAESQKFRCEMGSVIPSNKEVQAMECVTSNPAMIASLEQSRYSTPQGYIHGSWWDAMITLVNDVKNSSDEAGYQQALDNYSSKLENIFNY